MILLAWLRAPAAADYNTTSIKAGRFFDDKEWASAQALYSLVIDSNPRADSAYVRAIVTSSLLNDSVMASHFLTEAMHAGLSFTRIMNGVREESFAIGEADVYVDFLLRSQKECPWLSRAIDDELLSYYHFRDNGKKTVCYAERMLAGLPDSVEYLSMLADGYCMEGDFTGAVEVWNKILDIAPDNYDTLLKLGNYYDLTGDRLQGRAYLDRAYEIYPTPFVASNIYDNKDR